MAIRNTSHNEIMITDVPEIIMITIYGERSIQAFRELVQRATNLWPDAPPVMKEFADLITNGSILQDYRGQDTSKPRSELLIGKGISHA